MKEKLIHLLGGITAEEACDSNQHCLNVGKEAAYREMKAFSEMMHGTPADEWSRMMYDHICGTIKRLEQTAD